MLFSLSYFRYGFLLLESIAAKDPLSVSVAILHQFNILPEMYQVGQTKLFFRTGQVLYRQSSDVLTFSRRRHKLKTLTSPMQIGVLEDTRNRTLHGILRLQSCFRGHQARSRLREHKRRVTVLQSCITLLSFLYKQRQFQLNLNYGFFIHPLVSVVRGEKVRKEYTELLRRHRASAAIQSHVKRSIAKRRYKAKVDASLVIQSGKQGLIN